MHSLSNSLRELVGRARDIATTTIAQNAEEEDRLARWPAPAIRELGAAGLLGLNVPREHGGHGEGLTGLVAVCETLATESPSTALCFGMHCVGSAVVAAKATDYQVERYLRPIARGEHVTTLALSEPGTGSHFYVSQTALRHEGDGFVLQGTKSFVTNGGHADSYVISVVAADEESREGTFSCVLLDERTPGMRWQEDWIGFGMRSNSSRSVVLDGVRVPQLQLLGREGDQLWYVFEVVAPYFLMAMAGSYLGLAQTALTMAREYLGTRRHAHTGELLGAHAIPAHRLGELWMQLESTRQLIYSAARRADAGDPDALPAVLACKAAAGDTAVLVANEAMTLCGGVAYRENAKLGRLLRDARASHVMAPTTDMLKLWVGRALAGLPLLG